MLICRARYSPMASESRVVLFLLLGFTVFFNGCARILSPNVSFAQSAAAVQAYDFVEVTAAVSGVRPKNPFADAMLRGWFESADGSKRWPVEGFCDSADGSVFRIRFMSPAAGDYRYFVEYRQNHTSKISTG